MNLELADTYGGAVWLHSNAANEGMHDFCVLIK
jgi:hypothetical protein